MSSDGNNNGLSSFLVDKKGHDFIEEMGLYANADKVDIVCEPTDMEESS